MHALFLALALGQAQPAAPAAAAEPAASPLRAVDLTRRPDGSFLATLDGEPVAGADFYRAVLRPDLAARTEEAQHGRTALLIAAVVAPLAGVGMGWVSASAQYRLVPFCIGEPPAVDCTAHDKVEAQNQATMKQSLLIGGAAGLATGLVLAVAGSAIHPHQPTADEAEALVRAYRARGAPVPAVPAGGGGASLDLEAGPRAARLVLRVGF
jgi:hypothetical protein